MKFNNYFRYILFVFIGLSFFVEYGFAQMSVRSITKREVVTITYQELKDATYTSNHIFYEVDLGPACEVKIDWDVDLYAAPEPTEEVRFYIDYEYEYNYDKGECIKIIKGSDVGSIQLPAGTKVFIDIEGGKSNGRYEGVILTVTPIQKITGGTQVEGDISFRSKVAINKIKAATELDVNGTTTTKILDVKENVKAGRIDLQTGNQVFSMHVPNTSYAYFSTNSGCFLFNKSILSLNGEFGRYGAGNIRFMTNGSPKMTIADSSGNIGIGTETPEYRLDVKGIIRAEEILITTDGADFVFEEGYALRSLQEVKYHIQDKKHLPDIPSAKEMKEDGVGMADLQIKLLQKIEELTLYVISQQEEIEALKKELNKEQK
ncbi:hypothetical protein LJB92_03870 [Bacteroidales bacterium OttesenSCG-928-M06]|nr:hypothetical protein [Bacteroidales bacterium OttesenSCG-928-M06]